MIKKVMLGLLCLCFISSATAAWTTTKIDRILFVEKGNGGLVYIYPKGGVVDPPECHGANGDYTSFSVERPMAKEYISGLMAAMMANKTVGLRTVGDCVDQGVSDTLKYFTVYSDN